MASSSLAAANLPSDGKLSTRTCHLMASQPCRKETFSGAYVFLNRLLFTCYTMQALQGIPASAWSPVWLLHTDVSVQMALGRHLLCGWILCGWIRCVALFCVLRWACLSLFGCVLFCICLMHGMFVFCFLSCVVYVRLGA